jgi:hypothetical protein
MTNPWLKLSGIGLAALLGLGAPTAALAGGDSDAKFKGMDTNGDGRVSEDEFETVSERKFVEIDGNRDGRVTVMEMDSYKARAHKDETAKGGWPARYTSSDHIKKLDSNGDGSLTASEFEAGADAKFEAMDTNDDDYLTAAEWKAGHDKAHKGSGK